MVYATLNLLAHCRSGALGYNRATCQNCKHSQMLASSCGDRHCPQCLGPRQAAWAQATCQRLPDCAHHHIVFSPPKEVWEVFEANYRILADILFASAAETLQQFQRNNWGCDRGAFFSVLHTWGSQLNWHPHLHVLIAAGAIVLRTGIWKEIRPGYAFPVRAMSRVFKAIFIRKLELLEADRTMRWPEELRTVEARRSWRVKLCGRSWNIFIKPTLGNTRAVVRYLARYTSRIAISNRRIIGVDEALRTVTFTYTDYRDGAKRKELTLPGGEFIRRFARHLVPKGFRRVRQYGLLCGRAERFKEFEGAPQQSIAEQAPEIQGPTCPHCQGHNWKYDGRHVRHCAIGPQIRPPEWSPRLGSAGRETSFSLGAVRGSPG